MEKKSFLLRNVATVFACLVIFSLAGCDSDDNDSDDDGNSGKSEKKVEFVRGSVIIRNTTVNGFWNGVTIEFQVNVIKGSGEFTFETSLQMADNHSRVRSFGESGRFKESDTVTVSFPGPGAYYIRQTITNGNPYGRSDPGPFVYHIEGNDLSADISLTYYCNNYNGTCDAAFSDISIIKE
ncbi:hypothetical protein FACS189426_09150 [Bacteroidia bacterium]|nr:hypothetical protein FACS189426_09150 [Bacteroidia bacterium]